jgi:uncharacterized glyoxalase superfamily protein PhnB
VARQYRGAVPDSLRRPNGAPQVMPYLYYPDGRSALEFLTHTFGFSEIEAFRDDDGNVWHAQLSTGDGVVMIGPGLADFGTRAASDEELATVRIFVYVDDVDAHCEHARRAGAAIVSEPTDQGPNRIYIARDCGAHEWIFARPL